jgi:hypothetical protein
MSFVVVLRMSLAPAGRTQQQVLVAARIPSRVVRHKSLELHMLPELHMLAELSRPLELLRTLVLQRMLAHLRRSLVGQ